MEKIKLVFVNHPNFRNGSGTEKCLLYYCKYKPEDFEITILQHDYFDRERLPEKYIKSIIGNTKIITIKSFEWRLSRLWKSKITNRLLWTILPLVLFFLRLTLYKKVIKDLENVDIVYFFKNIYVYYFLSHRPIFIGSSHVSLEKSLETKLISKNIWFRKIDGFHYFSHKEEIVKTLNKKYNFKLPNGVDTEIFYPSPNHDKNKIKLLFVGRLDILKGVNILMDAWNLVKNEKFELHVVGGGGSENIIKERNDIVYHGIVSESDLGKIYRECDIFVFPSEVENFGLVILEALASGLYVITNDKFRNYFEDLNQLNFISFVKRDPESFAEEILNISSEIKKIRNNKGAIYEYIKMHYDWKVITNTLFSNFRRIYKEKNNNF